MASTTRNSILNWALEPIDNSQIVVFRIFFGLLMVAESFGAIITGWVKETFVEPNFTFTFIGFEWTEFLIGPQMYGYYVVMGLVALCVALGIRYRISIIVFTILWSTTYLMQKTHYNNHYYLIALVAFIMCFMPAHRYKSFDVKSGFTAEAYTCPRWCRWVFILLISMVYVYAAAAKLYPDWLSADPIDLWLSAKSDYPIVGPVLDEEWFHYFIAYSGIAYDFLIVPLLLWKRTRVLAIIFSLIFHLFNSAVFQIGVFPYFALTFAIFFFPPETIRKRFFKNRAIPDEQTATSARENYKAWPVYIMSAFLILQLLLPIRHYAIPGNVLWDESGHRLSWRMMLRTKTGLISFDVKTDKIEERVALWEYINRHQYPDLCTKPDLIWQFAQRLKKEYESRGHENVRVYCFSRVKVNKRETATLTDQNYDIGSANWRLFGRQPWVLDAPWE